jgi:hypothetical protein
MGDRTLILPSSFLISYSLFDISYFLMGDF